jgi:hypothetical protein
LEQQIAQTLLPVFDFGGKAIQGQNGVARGQMLQPWHDFVPQEISSGNGRVCIAEVFDPLLPSINEGFSNIIRSQMKHRAVKINALGQTASSWNPG